MKMRQCTKSKWFEQFLTKDKLKSQHSIASTYEEMSKKIFYYCNQNIAWCKCSILISKFNFLLPNPIHVQLKLNITVLYTAPLCTCPVTRILCRILDLRSPLKQQQDWKMFCSWSIKPLFTSTAQKFLKSVLNVQMKAGTLLLLRQLYKAKWDACLLHMLTWSYVNKIHMTP